jgi:4-hydroxythreonine-4-phosphate dehydrogenase
VNKPLIAMTMGDPAGIGPEICLRAMNDAGVLDRCTPVVFGNAGVMRRAAKSAKIKASFMEISLAEWNDKHIAAEPVVVDCGVIDPESVVPGKVSGMCGKASYAYLKHGVKAAKDGLVAALATAPIHKVALHLGGLRLPGHTEILAELTGAKQFCMMMAAAEIKIGLVTTHVAISKVPKLLTKNRIVEVIALTARALIGMGRTDPRIAVCGLNPHAGEEGLFGSEESAVIRPAIEEAISAGLDVEGPMSPDVAFLPEHRKDIDAYVVMYHDQGLIPFKMLAFDEGVNITLGLPIVRTSVDHGTAFDIAWKGKASAGSMIQAVLWALRLSQER